MAVGKEYIERDNYILMDYYNKLILRVFISLAIVLLPIDLFYFLLLKPTLYTSSIFLSQYVPRITEDSLIINNVALKFIPACIATLAYVLLLLLVLLTKDIGFKNGAKIFLSGAIIIFIANIIRIDSLIYVYFEYGSNIFDRLHLFIWQFLSGIFVAAVWIFLSHVYKIKAIPIYDDIAELYRRRKTN